MVELTNSNHDYVNNDNVNNDNAAGQASKPNLPHLRVYLAYAESAQTQHYLSLSVPAGTTLYQALAQAGWLTQFPALAAWCEQVLEVTTPTAKLWHVGIYAQKQPLNYPLQALDRIEVYRSLSADPMSQRKTKMSDKRAQDKKAASSS